MQRFWQDVRYALRMLLKNPSFSAIAIGTLALGIGANAAIFSVVNAVLLSPLPFPNSEQLVALWGRLPSHGLDKLHASAGEFTDYRERNQTFSSIAAYSSLGQNLTGRGEPERINVTYVTADFFTALGVAPQRGRTFSAQEDQLQPNAQLSDESPPANQAVILSHRLWQSRFAGDTTIIGQSLLLNGTSHQVVGVMPANFQFPDAETQIWKLMIFNAEDLSPNNRGAHFLSLVARIKPGVTLAQAQADVTSIARQMQQEYPTNYEDDSGWSASITSLQEELVGDTRMVLLVLFGAVGFVLLIACTNVANLLLARAASRQREIVIRAALGANRSQVIKQLLTENLLLALCGGSIGILLAWWGKDLLISMRPANWQHINDIPVDGRVVAFTFVVSLLTGLLFGLLPAWQASHLTLNTALKENSKATASRRRHRLRAVLVVSEIALALVLLAGAGLMIKSFYRLQQVDPGFEAANVLTMRLSLPEIKYPQPHGQRAFFEQLGNHIKALPDVQAVGVVNALPFSQTGSRRNISVEGKPENPINSEFRFCNPDYFHALNFELRAGRFFDERDHQNSTYVTVVNETFTRTFLPGEEALGKRIKMGGQQSPYRWLEIVGVVKDFKHHGLDLESRPEMFIPVAQPPLPTWSTQSLFLAVRTEGEGQNLLAAVRQLVQEMDSEQPLYSIATMPQLIAQSVAPRRFNMLMMLLFSVLALVLATVGIYGVMAYTVTERTQEIGIRLALGAQTTDVLRLVMGRGLRLTLSGIGIGLTAALALTRLLKAALFQVSATDPVTLAVVSFILAGVALAACFVPARRAAKTEPMIALRYE